MDFKLYAQAAGETEIIRELLSEWIDRLSDEIGRMHAPIFVCRPPDCGRILQPATSACVQAMNPRLAAIAGPLKGSLYALTGEEVSIGRDSSNILSIGDPSLSRRHCLITSEQDRFKLSDLDSFNGTFVNGVPVGERVLEDGDQIKIGDSLFLFLDHQDDQAITSSVVYLGEAKAATDSTVQLRVKDALYLNSQKLLATLPQSARIARDLNALLKISTAINSVRSTEALNRLLLELIFEVIPAERGAILLSGKESEQFTSVYGWDRRALENQVSVSRTILAQALSDKVAILSNDILADESLSSTESLLKNDTRSLLCVPLVVFDKAIGAIYLDASDLASRFDENHLQLVTAIASIAAVAFENARQVEWLESENRLLQEAVQLDHNMVGESPRIKQVYQFIARVAPTDSTVLIRGESGTGKELAARAIHLNSNRRERPFMAINCAALTETLLESELFGHERGAFTGAVAQKRGKLEVAEGGTLFLDEVGELAPVLQAKLLRVLQEREFERVGGTRSIKADVRVIAATNRDLEEAIKQGGFRHDLYYRLNVVGLVMPPLRERREDIPLLASYFVAKYAKRCKRAVSGISAQARALLMNYEWPGNVRELENSIERAVVLGLTDMILPEDLPESLLEVEPVGPTGVAKYHEAINDLKKQLITKAVEQANGNYTEAALLLGVHPNYLHRLVRNLNLKSALKK